MITVFGHHGQVATHLREEATRLGLPLRSFSSAEANFEQPETVAQIIRALPQPGVVINASAYTAVDLAESHVEQAHLLNAVTPGMIAQACRAGGHVLIHLSTDYVFPGDLDRPYTEEDQVGPRTAYGRTKLEGEERILESGADAVILRTAWVFSAYGKNFVRTMRRLGQERGAVTVVSDQRGCPTWAGAIARTCLEVAARHAEIRQHAALRGVFHYGGAPFTSWNVFAERIFSLAGMNVPVTPILTQDYPTPARRPLNSMLNCDKLKTVYAIQQPDWEEDLKGVVQTLQGK